MLWQDFVLTFCQIIFIVALFPSLLSKAKPALLTSVVTGLALLGITIVDISLSLTLAALSSVVTAILWFILGFQKYRQQS